MRTSRCKVASRQRSGSLLLVVLITVAVLALSVYAFSNLMLVEQESAILQTKRVQSKYLVDSGLEYTRLYLARPEAEIFELGGRWDNEEKFRGIPVVRDAEETGRVDGTGRFTMVAQVLMSLPDMTEEIASAILDFIDPDDEARESGYESNHYGSKSPPYNAKNGPLDSLDELLLVEGVTPELLFGLDINRNGILDDTEASLGGVSSTEAEMELGWANYLTLYSKENNRTGEGLPRININAEDLDQLYDDLKSTFDDDWVNLILIYRLEGPSETVPNEEDGDVVVTGAEVPFEVPENAESQFTFVEGTDADGNDVFVASPLRYLEMGPVLPIAMQSLTVYEGASIPGRINIMQAPRVVLAGIPGMDEELLEEIITVREYELDDPNFLDINRKYETWIMAEALTGFGEAGVIKMKALMPFICAKGAVYRTEIVGYFGDGRGTSRAEAVLDTTVPVPQVLLWRDKSHLQTGYSVEALGSELEGSQSR